MFKKPLLLKATEHDALTVADTTDWRFAAHEMLVPVVFSEMADIARERKEKRGQANNALLVIG